MIAAEIAGVIPALNKECVGPIPLDHQLWNERPIDIPGDAPASLPCGKSWSHIPLRFQAVDTELHYIPVIPMYPLSPQHRESHYIPVIPMYPLPQLGTESHTTYL